MPIPQAPIPDSIPVIMFVAGILLFGVLLQIIVENRKERRNDHATKR